jgi:hypothetical protein
MAKCSAYQATLNKGGVKAKLDLSLNAFGRRSDPCRAHEREQKSPTAYVTNTVSTPLVIIDFP